MGYPVYKLIRAVNRQYPNNGFIDYVDVTEETSDGIIDEDLRDLINEAIQETYIDIARDEVYSFPTVPGQNQYALPDDCELRDIQEVTRTFGCRPFPVPPAPEDQNDVTVIFEANGGSGYMPNMYVKGGETIVLPECTYEAPSGKVFRYWQDEEGFNFSPGYEYTTFSIGTPQVIAFKAIWYAEPTDSIRITFNPNGGTGTMPDMYVTPGDSFVLPECDFVGPDGESFLYWVDEDLQHYNPGDEYTTFTIGHPDVIVFEAIWDTDPGPVWEYSVTVKNVTPANLEMTLYFTPIDGTETFVILAGNGGSYTFYVQDGETLGDSYSSVYIIDHYGETQVVPTNAIITQNTLYEYTQFTTEADPEQPGDNGNGSEDNPLDNDQEDTDFTIGGD